MKIAIINKRLLLLFQSTYNAQHSLIVFQKKSDGQQLFDLTCLKIIVSAYCFWNIS